MKRIHIILLFCYLVKPKNIMEKAMQYAFWSHLKVGQFYDNHFYYYHVNMVANLASQFMPDYISTHGQSIVVTSAYLHDIIEDTRKTWNDVRKEFGDEVADIVYALSNEKGKSRADRANDVYYQGIRNTPFAVFVKLCDRAANIAYSRKKGSRMLDVYKKENIKFINSLQVDENDGLVKYINSMLNH